MAVELAEASTRFLNLHQWRQSQMEARSARMQSWVTERFVPLLVKEMDVDRVILFGSVARREATEGSDVDLLVISGASMDSLPWKNRMDQAYEILSRLEDAIYSVEIVVWSKEELAHKKKENSAFWQSIARDGLVLYER